MSRCIVKFRGAHIQHGCLKAGIAVFPAEGDSSYALHYVPKPVIPEGGYPGAVDGRGIPIDEDDFRAWLESLPTRMELNPAFTHFIKINSDTSLPDLETEIQRIFVPDVLKSADAFLSTRGQDERQDFSRYRKMMAARERLGNGLVLPKGYDAKGLITAANNKFKPLGGELDGKGKILDIKPGTIDVGSAATDRGSSLYLWNDSIERTAIDYNNAANASGEITSVKAWFLVADAGNSFKVGTFSDGGSGVFTCHDAELIGEATSGSEQTYSGLEVAISAGEYIGCDGRGTAKLTIERDLSGYSGVYYYEGDSLCDPEDSQTFSLFSGDAISLYGEGETAGVTEKSSSDTGAGADAKASGNPLATLVKAEAGSGSDVLSQVQAILDGAETGSGVDAVDSLQTPEAKTSSDAGSGAEGTPVQSAILAGSESGSGIEAVIARLLAALDTGGGAEASSLETEGQLKDLFASELGEGADRLVARIEMPTKGGGMKLWT
ncbi:MAG: hypothetical protein GH159_02280 [Dehalococcoidia bacterium]|nr:hypothetical protein [Dehalococcoidia bacterium]